MDNTESQCSLAIAVFQTDTTPPLGSPLCGRGVPPAQKVVDRLSARGVVLLTAAKPVVLCAVDWVGIGNGGHDAWREALADAADTTPDRVSVHTVHQHDAPGCDFSVDELLAAHGLASAMFDADFARDTISRVAQSVREAMQHPEPVTHLGQGNALVKQVASNRRIIGEDGRVEHVRFSSCADAYVRAAPEGTIDPLLRHLSFWQDDRPLASLTYYATHPQSFYGRGAVSTDFVGWARSLREATYPESAHIHFNGASGNVAAGKHNDGSPMNRLLLAQRLARGMEIAWDATVRWPIHAEDVAWHSLPVALPVRESIIANRGAFEHTLADPQAPVMQRISAARNLAWLHRCEAGHTMELSCLRLGSADVLHVPGEMFVEYQLAAQQMRPDQLVCMAAYGDYAPGYIGTAIAYAQGGYETGPVSRVAPEVEEVLLGAFKRLLAESDLSQSE